MNKHIVLVVGGPGKSGSSTIAKMLAEYFDIPRVYGGQFFRDEAKLEGFFSVKDFLEEMPEKEIEELDLQVDERLWKYVREGNVVIESKTFAGIATKEDIECTAKFWLDANLDVRAQRAVDKEDIKNPLARWLKKYQIKRDLVSRFAIDRERYKKLYGIQYENPERYNDLVIDNSNQTPDETFNLIINFLNDAGITK